jgi:hypothetical protein
LCTLLQVLFDLLYIDIEISFGSGGNDDGKEKNIFEIIF